MTKIYLVSGKGGVGKTSYSIALTKKIPGSTYAYIKDHESQKALDLKNLPLERHLIVQEYLSRVLKSKMIAKWIYELSIFQAMFNMVPFMSFMMYLGKIVDLFENDQDQQPLIFDAPSTGHFLTMIESFKNLQSIVKQGKLFNDAQKMLNFLNQENTLSIHLLTQPSPLDLEEVRELKSRVLNIFPKAKVKIICNKILSISDQELVEDLASSTFYKTKMDSQDIILNKEKSLIDLHLPFFVSQNNLEDFLQRGSI